MNREEAIKALMSIPDVTQVSRANLAPTDVIVVECEGFMTVEAMERIRDQLQEIWPGQKVVVLHNGLRMKIVHQAPDAAQASGDDGGGLGPLPDRQG